MHATAMSCLCVRMSVAVKFVKSLARWQHRVVSGGFSCRLQYTSYITDENSATSLAEMPSRDHTEGYFSGDPVNYTVTQFAE